MSLCTGWTVRQVVAHLVVLCEITTGTFLTGIVSNGFSLNKLNDAVDAARTQRLEYFGLRTLYDRYLLQIFDSVAQPLSISGYPNQPRTWGGTARFKF
ncbi:hypothetical protein B4Q13_19070 [Lacticaseibacillus rhamnosus]